MDRVFTGIDRWLSVASRAMTAVSSGVAAQRATPGDGTHDDTLDTRQRQLSAALMRVNHVGEVCAQALYEGQALSTPDPALRECFRQAAIEEGDHLAWTRERIDELGGRVSLLNPLWYAGALTFGMIAGRLGDRTSLGFMAETERQVEQHLDGHLQRLPDTDARSRAIVAAMKDDEVAHANTAIRHGAAELPTPVRLVMRAAARVMTSTAHYI